MSKHREVFDVLESTDYADASEKLALLLAAGQKAVTGVGATDDAVANRSFLEEVGLDGWATEDRHANGFHSLFG